MAPTHGFSSRLQQRYASTTAQGQQHVRLGVYHRGLNKLTSLSGGPVVATAAGPAAAGLGAPKRPPAAPRPVQTSSLKKENGGQDVTAVLVNRAGGKKVGWGSSLPAPAPASAPPAASLGPTPADAAAKEAAEKEKANRLAEPPQQAPPQQAPPPPKAAPHHPPLPPPPAPGNKNTPWALHPPSQPPTSLGIPPPLGDHPRPEECGPGGTRDQHDRGGPYPPPGRDYRDRRYDPRGGYPPNDRYGGGYDGGGRYGDQRRYSDGPYERPPCDDRRHYRDRDYEPRGDYYRDRDGYRNDYRNDRYDNGPGGYHRGGYGRERDYDFRGGGGSYQHRERYYRGDDRRWSDFGRNRNDDYRDGAGRRRYYDSDPSDGRLEYDRPTEPTRIHGHDEPRPRDAGDRPDLRDPNAGPNDSVRAQLWSDQQQARDGADKARPPEPPRTENSLHQPPPKSEVDAALEAVREREAAEARARRRKEELAKQPELACEGAGARDVGDERQRPSEDATAGWPPTAKATAVVQQPKAILQNSENQSSGEASGDASVVEASSPVRSRESKRDDSALSAADARTRTNALERQQNLEKIGEVRQSALVAHSAGQDSADVQPAKKEGVPPPSDGIIHNREETPEAEVPQKDIKSHCDCEEKPEGEIVAAPGKIDSRCTIEEQPEAAGQVLDTESTASQESSAEGSEKIVEFEECETDEERRRKQQQNILQQVAAARNKKEKQRRKEKKSATNNAPQVLARAKVASDEKEEKPMNKDRPAEETKAKASVKATRSKRRRNRRPRTQGVLYKRLSDGSFVNADLSEEEIARIEKAAEEKKQQQLQQQQRQEREASEKKKDAKVAATKLSESPRRAAADKKPGTPSKSQKEFVPAPPPAVSAWKQGPPPGIVKSSPAHISQPLGLLSGQKLSPDTPLFHQANSKPDAWVPSADFPKLGQEDSEDSKEAACWIPPPVETVEKQQEKRVIAAVGPIVENIGSWNAFSSGAPISAADADWSVGQTKVDTDWSRAAPAPVLNAHTDEDDTAHLTDGSGAVPRDLLSSAPGSEDDRDSSFDEKKGSSTDAKGQSKRGRRGRSRRRQKGRAPPKGKGTDSQNGKAEDKAESAQPKKSSRRGKKQPRPSDKPDGGHRATTAPKSSKPHSGDPSNQAPSKAPQRQEKSSSQKRKTSKDTKSNGKKSTDRPPPQKTAQKKKRSRRPPRSQQESMTR